MADHLFDLQGYVKSHKFSLKRALDFEVLRLVLKKKKSQRTDEELLYIKSALMQIPFLKRMLDSIESEHIHYTLLRQAQLKEFNSGKIIFEEDHIGKYLYVVLKGSVYLIRKQEKDLEDPIRSPTKKNTIIGRESTDFLLGDEEKLATHPLKLHFLPKLISGVASMSKMETMKERKRKSSMPLTLGAVDPLKRNRRMALTTNSIEPIRALGNIDEGGQILRPSIQTKDLLDSEAEDSQAQVSTKDQGSNPELMRKEVKQASIAEVLSEDSEEERKKKKEEEEDKEALKKIRMMKRLNRPKPLKKQYLPLFSKMKMQKVKSTNIEDLHAAESEDDNIAEEDENQPGLTDQMLKEVFPHYKQLAKINAPDYFGEIGFQDSTMRQATAIAKEYCFMILLPSLQYHTALKEYFENQNKEILKLLKNLPLTRGWPVWSLSALAKQAELVTFEKGQNLFAQGDDAKHLYIIKQGEVQLTKDITLKCPEETGLNSATGDFKIKQFRKSRLIELNRIWKDQSIKNQTLKIAFLGVGEIVGDLDNSKYINTREYTATCISDHCEAYKILTKEFFDCSKDPDLFYREIVLENPKRIWRDDLEASLRHTSKAMYNIKQDRIERESEREWMERVDKSMKEFKANPTYDARLIGLKAEHLYHKFDILKAYNDAADKWKKDKEKAGKMPQKAASVRNSRDESSAAFNAYMKNSVDALIHKHDREQKEKPDLINENNDLIKSSNIDNETRSSPFNHVVDPFALMDKKLKNHYDAARRMAKLGNGKDTAYNAYISPLHQSVFATAGSQLSSMTMEESSLLQEKLSSVLKSMVNNPGGTHRRNRSYSEKDTFHRSSIGHDADETTLIISQMTPKVPVPLPKDQHSPYCGEGSFISSQSATKLEHILQPIDSRRASGSRLSKDEPKEKLQLQLNEVSMSLRKMGRHNSNLSVGNKSPFEDTSNNNNSAILKGLKENSFQFPTIVDLNANFKLRRTREPHAGFRSASNSPSKLKLVL